jgi:hypothetical protein
MECFFTPLLLPFTHTASLQGPDNVIGLPPEKPFVRQGKNRYLGMEGGW